MSSSISDIAGADQAASLCPLGMVLTAQRQIEWCNERFAANFGYPRDALIGQSMALLYPTATEFERVGQRGQAALFQSGSYEDERLMRLHDGSLRWFRVLGRALDRNDPFHRASWLFEPLRVSGTVDTLSVRQREVLSAMTRGLTSKEAARELGISPRTVEKIRAQLMQRYDVHNAAALMSRISGMPG
jgi:PAS domain S-box-containing protein